MPNPPAGLPQDRRSTRTRWVQRGRLAVQVKIEVIFPTEDPSEPCMDAATARWLAEIAQRAEVGDVAYLKTVGRVFREVTS